MDDRDDDKPHYSCKHYEKSYVVNNWRRSSFSLLFFDRLDCAGYRHRSDYEQEEECFQFGRHGIPYRFYSLTIVSFVFSQKKINFFRFHSSEFLG